MQKFERFIIYPMLFVALFFSFSDNGVQHTIAQEVHDEIVAKNVKIVDGEGNVKIDLRKSIVHESGDITIYDNNGGSMNLGPYLNEGLAITFLKKSNKKSNKLGYIMPLSIGYNEDYSFVSLYNYYGDGKINLTSE